MEKNVPVEHTGDNPVNILYLTTKCNFRCPYCYEGQNNVDRTYKFITNKEIETFVDNIVETTLPSINNYVVCLMGGEPFIGYEQMKYFMEYIKKYTLKGKYFSVNVITNGSLVQNYMEDIKNWMNQSGTFYGIDISYDGSFQYRRTPTKIVEKNMQKLIDNHIPFGLSYTITKDNYQDSIYLKDIVYMIKKWLQPFYDDSHQRIRININWNDFYNLNSIEEKLESEFLYLYKKFQVPLCQYNCKYCKKCDFSNTGKKYMIPETGIELERNYTEKSFNHF